MPKTKLFRYDFQNNDIRSGPSLYYYDSDNDSDNDYIKSDYNMCMEIKLVLPKKKYIVYIIEQNCDNPKVILSKEFNKHTNANKFLLQAYSLINDQSPFIVTGHAASYTQIGDYGDPVPITYTKLKNIDKDSIDSDSYIHGVIISKKNEFVIDNLAIQPCE